MSQASFPLGRTEEIFLAVKFALTSEALRALFGCYASECGPSRDNTHTQPKSPKFGRVRPDAETGPTSAAIAQCWSHPGQIRLTSDRIWPITSACGRVWPKHGRHLSKFGPHRSCLDRDGATIDTPDVLPDAPNAADGKSLEIHRRLWRLRTRRSPPPVRRRRSSRPTDIRLVNGPSRHTCCMCSGSGNTNISGLFRSTPAHPPLLGSRYSRRNWPLSAKIGRTRAGIGLGSAQTGRIRAKTGRIRDRLCCSRPQIDEIEREGAGFAESCGRNRARIVRRQNLPTSGRIPMVAQTLSSQARHNN